MYFKDTTDYYYKDLGDIAFKSKGITPSFIYSIILGTTFFLILTLLIYPNPLLMISFDAVRACVLRCYMRRRL